MRRRCGSWRSATSRTWRKSTGERHPERSEGPGRTGGAPHIHQVPRYARDDGGSAQRRGHFSQEVVVSLLDSFAKLVADEAGHDEVAALLPARRLQVLRDALLVALDVGLLEEARLAVELLHLAGDHLLDDVLRLAGLAGLLAGDLPLRLQVLLRHVLA